MTAYFIVNVQVDDHRLARLTFYQRTAGGTAGTNYGAAVPVDRLSLIAEMTCAAVDAPSLIQSTLRDLIGAEPLLCAVCGAVLDDTRHTYHEPGCPWITNASLCTCGGLRECCPGCCPSCEAPDEV